MRIRSGIILSLFALLLAACNLLTAPGEVTTAISGPPVVQIAAPQANATFLQNVSVNIQALVTNAGADIDRIEIAVAGQIVHNLRQPNVAGAPSFTIAQSWQPTGTGQFEIGVTAFRADGSSSAPASVTINVIAPQASPLPASATPTTAAAEATPQPPPAVGNDTQPTDPPAPNNAVPDTNAAQAQPTTPPQPTASPTPQTPIITVNVGINVRSGPGVTFAPPIGSLKAGDTAPLLAKSSDGAWYRIQYYNSNNAWVAAQNVTPSVDPAQLPVEAGPAPPPPTATPIPQPTAPPVPPTAVSSVNLVAGTVRIEPNPPSCNQTFTVFVDVANFGSTASNGGTIRIIDRREADGSEQQRTNGAFGPIPPGQTVNSGPIPITVSTFHTEVHRIVVIIDPDSTIAETNEGDNQNNSITYTLAQAGC